MKGKIVTYSFTDNFLKRLAQEIVSAYGPGKKDLRRLALVFPGRRPALFLRRELAERFGKSFYAPKFFSIDEFMALVVRRQERFSAVKDLDQSYLLYQLAQAHAPHILDARESFAAFLPWAREIQRFIENLDLEQVKDDQLLKIEASAAIGYDVPEEINRLLASLVTLRRYYHAHMQATQIYSRGWQYWRASVLAAQEPLAEFDEIFFGNFFYLNRCEAQVVKSFYDRGKASLFFQGDERRWPVLKNLADFLGATLQEGAEPQRPAFELKLYSAFDSHSQAGIAKEILREVEDLKRTAIVLPDTGQLIPLLSAMTAAVEDFNVSMGYPLRRSALYSLFDFIFSAQLSRRGKNYYAHDYLKVLRHPLVKNLKLAGAPLVPRVLIHKIEEILTGQYEAGISGQLFFGLEEVANCDALYSLAHATLSSMGVAVSPQDLRDLLAAMHQVVFQSWEANSNFYEFGTTLDKFLEVFLRQSSLASYPLNLKIAQKMQDLAAEFETATFAREKFSTEELFKIFLCRVEAELVAFSGSPLKGLQILGLFETRALNFDNVIVLDVNEGVLPRLKVQDPLIPREVLLGLKLDRLEQEEEIQRYQFMRLLSSAKKVHLLFQENRRQERSRFVEELVWLQQKSQAEILGDSPVHASFALRPTVRQRRVAKTPAMLECLRQHTFSASSINSYLRNPYEFYLNYVLGLKEKEDLLDEPENRQVGTFVHELLKETFAGFLGRRPVLDDKFKAYFRACLESRFGATFARSMRCESFLLKAVLEARLGRFLEVESQREVAELLFVEKDFSNTVSFSSGLVKFVYKLDRVDRLRDGTVLILDYKTGSVDPMPRAIDKIAGMELSRATIFENVKSFQIPLYFALLTTQFPGDPINAAFYNLRTAEVDYFFNEKMKQEKPLVAQAFHRALDFIVAEIFDLNTDFVDDELA